MSPALDEFGHSLVAASRALYDEAERAQAAPVHDIPRRGPARGRLIRRARNLTVMVQLGVALSGGAAVAAGAYLILHSDQTKTLGSIECNVSHNAAAIVPTVTGDPIVDCALVWPSATAGRAAAPPLTAWGLTNHTKAAVVQPTAWGPPPPIGGVRWRRLDSEWTLDPGVTELTDQLNDISSPLKEVPINAGAGPPCTYVSADARLVDSLLRADGLKSWRVLTRRAGGASASDGCRSTIPNVDGSTKTVQLVQFKPTAPGQQNRLSAKQRRSDKQVTQANRALAALATRLNRTLNARCESVKSAAALWTTNAARAGLHPATLSYFRALNAAPRPVPIRLDLDYYTLATQPSAQQTGRCAHLLVIQSGGGGLTVYAARITA